VIIEPADLTVTIVNGAVITQAYTARIKDDHNVDIDVTSEAAFTLADPGYGRFAGATLSITGQGAGPTRVEASARGRTGDASLVVYVKKTVVDPATPTAPSLFAAATEDPARAPVIVYPPDRILVPPNLGQFDVHWNNNAANTDNLFEVTMANQYVDVRLYTPGVPDGTPYWTVYPPDTWYPIASSRQQLALKVAGLDRTQPATKGTAAAQHVDVTNENTQGGIYYWTSSSGSIMRYDVGKPNIAPAPYFRSAPSPTVGCVGCHTLSRDGTKMAMTLDGATGRGAIFNVADRTALIPFDGPSPLRWDFAAFDALATRLITVEDGQLIVRGLNGAELAGPLPVAIAGRNSTQPEISPDNTRMVNVEYTGETDWDVESGALVIRSFDAANNSFGAPTVLVASAPGIENYYPSFSPDSQWVVFTRTTSNSYDNASARTWLVKADGTKPPIQLATANLDGELTNSWARWVPFGQTFGPGSEPMFYLTFSSKRAFGVRLAAGDRPQIWMTPIFPARAAAGQDPSGNAFRVPFQDIGTSNHIAQWTQAVVTQ
jgi:hypothetical protein